MLNIALPKGRGANKAYKLLEMTGYACPELLQDSRKLVFINEQTGVKYFLVKPADVAIYVEYGIADIGIVGKDILLEGEPDVYELLDLKFGKCRMAVAAPQGYRENPGSLLHVATKYPNITRAYYQKKNREIEIIKLHGSIELAPILGLSDVIVDIVETGKTLVENGLNVYEEILPISARLIANKPSYKFKNEEIQQIVAKISEKVAL